MWGYGFHSWGLALAFLVTQALGSSEELARVQDAVGATGATAQEQRLLSGEIQRYVAFGGDEQHLVGVVEAGLERGCTETCLFVLVRGTVDAMDLGLQDGRAAVLTVDLLDRLLERQESAVWSSNQLAAHLERTLGQWLAVQRAGLRARLTRAAW